MKLPRVFSMLLLALVATLFPATSRAAVFVSVGIAPPVLPVYVQPPCPQPGFLWTPGYWGYGPAGYYWIPGAWVAPPAIGMLWTPPYWGWGAGAYIFHPGYWGPHVGYYGGINYGFGYMGVGFVGGYWHGGEFAYNRAVMNVNTTVIHNTYINRTVVIRYTVNNVNHVAYSGGPGGINHPPSPQERVAMNESHMQPTAAQAQHMQAAARDPQQRFSVNHGQPHTFAASRPLSNPGSLSQRSMNQGGMNAMNRGSMNNGYRPSAQSRPQQNYNQSYRANQGYGGNQGYRPQAQDRANNGYRPQAQYHPESHPQARPPEGGGGHPHGGRW